MATQQPRDESHYSEDYPFDCEQCNADAKTPHVVRRGSGILLVCGDCWEMELRARQVAKEVRAVS